MRKIIAVLAMLICSNFVNATEQEPDYLYYNGKKLTLYTGWGHPFPLEVYYYQNDIESLFEELSTENYRGHIAIWGINDNKLYLKEITIKKFSLNEKNEYSSKINSFSPKEYQVKLKIPEVIKAKLYLLTGLVV